MPRTPVTGFCVLSSLIAFLACLLPVPAPATTDCVEYAGHMAWLGMLDMPDSVTAIAIAGDRAVLAAGRTGLRIVDISMPSLPVLLATLDTPGRARDVALLGDYALVADGLAGLQIVWIGDPAQARIATSVPVPGDAMAVDVEGTIACVAAGLAGGLLVVDLSDPEAPLTRGSVSGTSFSDIDLEGSLAVGVNSSALLIYNLADPQAPVLVGSLAADPVPDDWTGIVFKSASVSSGLAAVVMEWSYYDPEGGSSATGARLVDLSDPAAPVLRGGQCDSGTADAVWLDGDIVYTTENLEVEFLARGGFLSTWSVANPDAPVNLGFISLHQPGGDLVVTEGRACTVMFAGSLLEILAVDPATSPSITLEADAPYWLTGLGLDGDWAYGALLAQMNDWSEQSGVVRWLRSAPENPQSILLRMIPTSLFRPWTFTDLTFRDGWLYAAYAESILVADVRAASVGSAELLGEPLGGVKAIAGSGSRLVAVLPRGLVVKSLADPARPTTLGSLVLPEYCRSVVGLGDLAWIGGSGALHVVRVADDGTPVLVRTLPVTGEVISLAVSDQFLVAGCELPQALGQMLVYDLTDPENPAVTGAVPLPAYPLSLQLSGRHVYAALGGAGLAAVDCSALEAPRLLGVAQPGSPYLLGGVNDVVLDGDRLLLASNKLVVARLDCTDPLPIWVPDFEVRAAGGGVALTWTVSGSATTSEFRIVAARDGQSRDVPCAPRGDGTWVATDRAPLAPRGGPVRYTLWGRVDGGGDAWTPLANATWTPPATPARAGLLGAHPNPFNPRTTIAFALARAQSVRLSIHDLAGREVAVLVDGAWAAGSHDVVWTGCDARGRAVASGSYMAVLKTEDGRYVTPLGLVR